MPDFIERWDEAAIEAALASGAINRRGERGATPLWHAVYFGRADWVTRLLDRGADLDAHNPSAIRRSSGDGFIVEVWRGVPDSATLAPTGRGSLLHVGAARVGDPGVADVLLDHGVALDGRDRFGATALHVAAFASNGDYLARLLDRGADPNWIDATGFAALDHAIGKPALMRALLDAGASPDGGPKVSWYGKSYEWSAVTYAAYLDRDGVLAMLLDAGADVARHPQALPMAAKYDKAASVRRLLAAGADVDATIHWRSGDRPALVSAAMYASVDCVNLLIDRCAHQLDDALRTAVVFTCEDLPEPPNDRDPQRRQVVALLLAAGADPNAALTEAAGLDTLHYLDTMLDAGADPDRPDEQGRRAIHVAADVGAYKAVRRLIEVGADVTAEDARQNTPWRLAERAYNDRDIHDARLVLQALRGAGAAPPVPPVPSRPKPVELAAGARVTHQKFGPGVVKSVDGAGGKAKVTVEFESESDGTKIIQARFLALVT